MHLIYYKFEINTCHVYCASNKVTNKYGKLKEMNNDSNENCTG